MKRISIVSGGFDPIHSGHVALIREAANHGDVVVLLNSDAWLTRKKGRPFMDWNERETVLRAIVGVIDVMAVDDGDGTVCNGIQRAFTRYADYDVTFCNGGDRRHGNTPETAFCEALGIKLAWNIGGGKEQSSTGLLSRWMDA